MSGGHEAPHGGGHGHGQGSHADHAHAESMMDGKQKAMSHAREATYHVTKILDETQKALLAGFEKGLHDLTFADLPASFLEGPAEITSKSIFGGIGSVAGWLTGWMNNFGSQKPAHA
mgnify:CR=1 FL=1